MIRLERQKIAHYSILYDANVVENIGFQWFERSYWEQQNKVIGGAPGRGTSCFIDGPEQELVLRHYMRGGLIGKVLQDLYLWTGLKRTRAWQEVHLLTELYNMGLPVPAPVAARVQRFGLWYKADLITAKLPDVVPLADVINQLPVPALQQVGKTIHRFHQAGLYHVDLNPRNIVLNPITEEVFLLDFDRCRLHKAALDPLSARRNLQRLHRAFVKLDEEKAEQWSRTIAQAYNHA